MDPLSITTSVITLIDFVSKTASALRKYIGSVKNAEESQRNLLSYLRSISSILNRIQFEAEGQEQEFQYLNEDLERCRDVVQNMLQWIEDVLAHNNLSERMKWPSREQGKVKGFTEELKKYLELFNTALNADSQYVHKHIIVVYTHRSQSSEQIVHVKNATADIKEELGNIQLQASGI